jgi:putative transcription factor
MSFQDWQPVSWDKRGEKRKNESKTEHLNRNIRTGNVATVAKQNINKAGSSGINEKVMSAKKLENEQDTFIHKKVSLSMSKRIAQARCAQKLSQKDLAFKLSLPVKIIQDYESGVAIPNHVITNKIEKVLGKIRD